MNEALRESAIAFTAADRASREANDEKQVALMKINTIIADELQSAGINARVVTCGRGASYSINIQIFSPEDTSSNSSPSTPGRDSPAEPQVSITTNALCDTSARDIAEGLRDAMEQAPAEPRP